MLDPHGHLADVHPDLVRVLKLAQQSPQPFTVTCGLRSLAAEHNAIASGNSQTLHSRHLACEAYGGVALAVDVAALTGGLIDWAEGRQGAVYGKIGAQVLQAAQLAHVRVQWGGQVVGAWEDGQVSHFRDWGHFQLDPSTYPG